MEYSEERLVETQLEEQLHEQSESLDAINEALTSDPTNPELLEIHEELIQAIKHAKEGIFELKRARLLREADTMLGNARNSIADVKVEPLVLRDVKPHIVDLTGVRTEIIDLTDDKPEPLTLEEDPQWCIGSKCRFQYNDQRWYDGDIVGLEGDKYAKIAFSIPTSETMLMCKFFLQQRCRFGSSCRLSHGIDVPLALLKKHVPTTWSQSLVGSNIWASVDKGSIWKKAELESWNDQLHEGQVVFLEDGRSVKLGPESITLTRNAQVSDGEDEGEGDSVTSDSSDDEEDNPQGLGFLQGTIIQKGIQTETAKFAKWENHTRGIASKMMASMGYREGMGLGASGQGILNPVSVKVLPPRQSLDHAVANDRSETKKDKKRSRGGKRKRDKKFAEASRAAKKSQDSVPDVFSLINTHLGMHSESPNSGSSIISQNGAREGNEDRRALVAFNDEVKALKYKIIKLEEMVQRNKNEKIVFEAAKRKLNEARKTLAETEAAHASVSDALASKEKEKRWLKF